MNGGMTTEGAGTAGASAQRTYERRRASDEAKIRARWGRLGGVAVALSDERQSTTAWASGARGERVVGEALDRVGSDDVRVLHDRRIPRSRANIDHLAVTAAGVWVIDAKRYANKRPALQVDGGILRKRIERLLISGRDHTKLVDGVLHQVELVEESLPGIPVRGALCFVDADWPLFGGAFTVRGVEALWPKRLVARLSAGGAGAGRGVDVGATTRILTERFRPA